MMDERTKETLERAKCALSRHLEDLMDEVDGNGGRISSRTTLGGIHESLEAMSWAEGLSREGNAEPAGKAASKEKVAL